MWKCNVVHILICICVGRCAFGIDTDMQNDINNPYLKKAAEDFETDFSLLSIVKLSNLIPFLARPVHDIFFSVEDIRKFLTKWIPFLNNYVNELPAIWLINRVQDVINLRTKSPAHLRNRVDLLQLMMDASTSEKVIVSLLDENLRQIREVPSSFTDLNTNHILFLLF
jgi:hypothetical protein